MTAAPHGPHSSHLHRGAPQGYPAAGGMPPSSYPPSAPRDLMNVPHLQGHSRNIPPTYGSIPLPSATQQSGQGGYEQASTSAIAPNPTTSTSTAIVPYTPPESPVTPIAAPAPKSKSSFSFNDIKGALDRLGGIDGIISHVGKVQKVMQSVSEMMPMAKMLVGSFTSSKKKKGEDDEELFYDPRRKKKRRPNSSKPRKKRPTASKTRPRSKSRPLQPRR